MSVQIFIIINLWFWINANFKRYSCFYLFTLEKKVHLKKNSNLKRKKRILQKLVERLVVQWSNSKNAFKKVCHKWNTASVFLQKQFYSYVLHQGATKQDGGKMANLYSPKYWGYRLEINMKMQYLLHFR